MIYYSIVWDFHAWDFHFGASDACYFLVWISCAFHFQTPKSGHLDHQKDEFFRLFRPKKMRVLLVNFGAKMQNKGYPLCFSFWQQNRPFYRSISAPIFTSKLRQIASRFAWIRTWKLVSRSTCEADSRLVWTDLGLRPRRLRRPSFARFARLRLDSLAEIPRGISAVRNLAPPNIRQMSDASRGGGPRLWGGKPPHEGTVAPGRPLVLPHSEVEKPPQGGSSPTSSFGRPRGRPGAPSTD